MSENIGYHTRLDSNNTVKVCGGSFGGRIDKDTVERIVKAFFTVEVQPSGRPVFVDREGRKVSLYFSIDPGKTEAGRMALAEYRREREVAQQAEQEKEQEVQNLLEGMTTEEALRRLKGE